MNQIKGFSGIAPRRKGGKVEYHLWLDDKGALYAQIVRNITDAKEPGSHSRRLFRVSDNLDLRGRSTTKLKLEGLDPFTFKKVNDPGATNDAGFLKYILKHLFPLHAKK